MKTPRIRSESTSKLRQLFDCFSYGSGTVRLVEIMYEEESLIPAISLTLGKFYGLLRLLTFLSFHRSIKPLIAN